MVLQKIMRDAFSLHIRMYFTTHFLRPSQYSIPEDPSSPNSS